MKKLGRLYFINKISITSGIKCSKEIERNIPPLKALAIPISLGFFANLSLINI